MDELRNYREILLLAVAEVPLNKAAVLRRRPPDVCDSYIRVTPETTGPCASPKDETREHHHAAPRLLNPREHAEAGS
jgi:hypothetical protein